MQTPTQVSGQDRSPAPCGPHQNVNAPSGTRLPWPRWQSEQDSALRRQIFDKILQIIEIRKPHVVTPEWQEKVLPQLLKRVEVALYQNAPSKDAYADLYTLELRMQSAARRMVPRQLPRSVGSSAPTGDTVSTPGAT